MNEQELQAIEERANAATPGPWSMQQSTLWLDVSIGYLAHGLAERDKVFIAHAREDVPALIAEVRELRAKLDAVPIDAIRAIYDSVPVNNWTRAPLKAIRQWLASLGKQVSL